MEEVIWKEIDDLTINHHLHYPFTNPITAVSRPHHHHHHATSFLDFLSTSPTRPKHTNPKQIPLTTLSLSLGPSYNYIEQNSPVNKNRNNTSNNKPTPVGIAAVLPSLCKKRPHVRKNETRDQRRMRLIKNRESSARSREKKQAHMDSLEKQLASLRMENAKLRLWLENKTRLSQTTPSGIPKRHKLHRTLTAPF